MSFISRIIYVTFWIKKSDIGTIRYFLINRCWERMQLMLILPVATFLQNPVLQPLATADYFQKRVGCWHHIPLNRQQLPSNHLPSQFLSTDIDQDTLTVILMSTADVGDRLNGMVQHSVGSGWILERPALSLLFNTVSWWDSCRSRNLLPRIFTGFDFLWAAVFPIPNSLQIVSHLNKAWGRKEEVVTSFPSAAWTSLMFQHFGVLYEMVFGSGQDCRVAPGGQYYPNENESLRLLMPR